MSENERFDLRHAIQERRLVGEHRQRVFRTVLLAAVAVGLVAAMLLFW